MEMVPLTRIVAGMEAALSEYEDSEGSLHNMREALSQMSAYVADLRLTVGDKI